MFRNKPARLANQSKGEFHWARCSIFNECPAGKHVPFNDIQDMVLTLNKHSIIVALLVMIRFCMEHSLALFGVMVLAGPNLQSWRLKVSPGNARVIKFDRIYTLSARHKP